MINPDVPRVPKYSSHTNVRRNVLTADDEKLKYLPYLGEIDSKKEANFKRLIKDLEEAYSAKRGESSRESDRASRIRSYLDTWLEDLDIGCNEQTLVQYILSQESNAEELR